MGFWNIFEDINTPNNAPPLLQQVPTYVNNPQVDPTPRQVYDQATESPQPGQRSPDRWQPKNIVLAAGEVRLLATPTLGRAAVIISNTGAATAQIRNTQNLNVGFWTLGATGTPSSILTLDTEGEIWVTSVTGTTIEVIETFFDLISGVPGGQLGNLQIESVLDRQELDYSLFTDDLLTP